MSDAPSPQQAESMDDNSRFLLHSKSEIVFVLREMIEKGAFVTVYFQNNKAFILSALIDVNADKNYFLFDVGGEEHANEKLAASDRLMFVAALNGVKIQFVTGRAKLVRYRERDTFIAALPADVLRLQRREFFRVNVPVTAGVSCSVHDSKYGSAVLKIHDISLGGVSLVAEGDFASVKVRDRLDECGINLGDHGQFPVALEIRRVAPVQQKNGVVVTHLGCQFLNLKQSYQNIVQRYLVHLQREQSALAR